MHTIKKTQGASLLETILCLAVIAIISGISLASSSPLSNFKANIERRNMLQFFKSSRNSSLLLKSHVHTCVFNQQQCIESQHWQRTLVSFADTNNNQRYDKQERILHTFSFTSKDSYIKSKHMNYIRFNKLGMSKQFGSFIYCYKDNTLTRSNDMSLSMQGKFKLKERDQKSTCP